MKRSLMMFSCMVFAAWHATCSWAQSENAGPNPGPVSDSLASYRLVPQDKLRCRIAQDPAKDLDVPDLLVSALGYVSFPVTRGHNTVVTLEVRGKTLAEVQRELRGRLEEDYYHTATVQLELIDQSKRFGRAIFFGSVRGAVQLRPGEPTTVSEAILQLGYDEFANLKKVKINRLNPETRRSQTIDVDVYSVLKRGNRRNDIVLQDGDRIEVPEKGILF